MTQSATQNLQKFTWEPQPAAQAAVNALLKQFLDACPRAGELATRMKKETATRFADWVDFIEAPSDEVLRARLLEAGFTPELRGDVPECYVHHGGLFPRIVLGSGMRVGIKVESVADFAAAWGVPNSHETLGGPLSPLRLLRAFAGKGADLWAVERHGCRDFVPPPDDPAYGIAALRHLEAFRRRERSFETDAEGLGRANELVDAAAAELGVHRACDVFFAAERDYWQRRNRAARVQKARQDALGLGWANHDHHTYRSSRHCFADMIALFEKLGFHCRERFYTGAEAGWGAQVLEQPVCGLVIFADVDLSEEEIMGDFAHEPLPPRDRLGTVGLWCGLHGESILQAGMHHLECVFDHEALKEQLAGVGIQTMDPFTNFPFLRQAFTEGERWNVSPMRIERLQEAGLISREQAEQFKEKGAIGSHLENLERNDGYKGFNQRGVSDIIARTDPRRQPAAAAP
jgi:hypothetical protein